MCCCPEMRWIARDRGDARAGRDARGTQDLRACCASPLTSVIQLVAVPSRALRESWLVRPLTSAHLLVLQTCPHNVVGPVSNIFYGCNECTSDAASRHTPSSHARTVPARAPASSTPRTRSSSFSARGWVRPSGPFGGTGRASVTDSTCTCRLQRAIAGRPASIGAHLQPANLFLACSYCVYSL